MDRNSKRLTATPNPALADLAVLLGEWDLEGSHPMLPSPVHGHASFSWSEDGAFIVWRSHFEQPGPPSAIAAIGRDDSGSEYCMLYFDERGVSRVYTMSLEGKVWQLSRNSPGFSQRMTATISDDGNTITSQGIKTSDGAHWDGDLDLVYTKVREK